MATGRPSSGSLSEHSAAAQRADRRSVRRHSPDSDRRTRCLLDARLFVRFRLVLRCSRAARPPRRPARMPILWRRVAEPSSTPARAASRSSTSRRSISTAPMMLVAFWIRERGRPPAGWSRASACSSRLAASASITGSRQSHSRCSGRRSASRPRRTVGNGCDSRCSSRLQVESSRSCSSRGESRHGGDGDRTNERRRARLSACVAAHTRKPAATDVLLASGQAGGRSVGLNRSGVGTKPLDRGRLGRRGMSVVYRARDRVTR